MLFGLWGDAIKEQGWVLSTKAANDLARDQFTRETLGLAEDVEIPSWSALTTLEVSVLRKRLGELAANLSAAMDDDSKKKIRQALWAIEACGRGMCSLGPAYCEFPTSDWNAYIKSVLVDISRGTVDDFRRLPLTDSSYVDLNNLSKLMWNRFYKQVVKVVADGWMVAPKGITSLCKQIREQVMAEAMEVRVASSSSKEGGA